MVLGTTLDKPMVMLGGATDLVPLGAVGVGFVALLIKMGRRSDAVTFLTVVGIALASNPIFKLLIARPRPDSRTVPETLSTYSFPSGHAASIQVGIAGSIVLIAVGFSRLAVGAHYPHTCSIDDSLSLADTAT